MARILKEEQLSEKVTLKKGAFDRANEKRVGFLFQVGKCIDCNSCVDACRACNATPDYATPRRHITTMRKSDGTEVYLSSSCMHCDDPACVKVCPAHAIEKLDTGIVALHPDRCIGCKYCYEACPFSVPRYEMGVMDKCDFCVGNGVEPGYRPRCATACPTGALDGGFLRDVLLRAQKLSDEAAMPEDGQKTVPVVVDTSEVEGKTSQIESSTEAQMYLIEAQS